MQLRIDPEFESRIPPLTDDEFQQLEENILADGVIISPIVVWEGVVIDGHNRFRIVEKHPHISFTTCERQFDNRHEALAWICKNQLGRRNLTFQQKKYLIGRQYESEKASEKFHGNQYIKVQSGGGQNVHHQKTAERIAEENGINEKTVRRAAECSISRQLPRLCDFLVDLIQCHVCDAFRSGDPAGFFHRRHASVLGDVIHFHTEGDAIFLNET